MIRWLLRHLFGRHYCTCGMRIQPGQGLCYLPYFRDGKVPQYGVLVAHNKKLPPYTHP